MCASAASLIAAPVTLAAPVPSSPQRVQIVARDQPIGEFLRDLFAQARRPVIVSQRAQGTVNGSFEGTVDKVFADIARAFNLIGYYDGAAVYVYAASEATVQVVPAAPGTARLIASRVNALRLADQGNLLRVSGDGSVVASGTPRFVAQVSEIATALAGGDIGRGAPRRADRGDGGGPGDGYGAAPLEFRVFYLRYARAEDTTVTAGGREVRVPGLATIIGGLVLDRPPAFGATPAGGGSRTLRSSQPRLGGRGLGSVPPSIEQTPILGGPEDDESGYPVESFDGTVGGSSQTRIQANPYLNALIVRDTPERMAAYESLVQALDVEPQLVEVEATIIDINTTKLRELGINWRFSSGGFSALFGDGTENDLRLFRTPGTRRDNTENVTPTNRGIALSTVLGSAREFIGRISALEAKGAARIVSRPQIMTLSNVEAVFDRTRTFYVRVAGDRQVDLFNVTAGTVLRVNPHVFRDRDQTRIRVQIEIEDGGITAGEVEDIPIIERSSVATQAMIADGESLLLGGMTVDRDIEAIDKIPLLGDIPLLGELFKTRSRERGRIERLFLITPRVATLTARMTTVPPPVPVPSGAPVDVQPSR